MGVGSGNWVRWDTKPVIEDGLTLDLCKLIRGGMLLPGNFVNGTLTWRRTQSNEKIASIRYSADLTSVAGASLHLQYNHNGRPIDCQILVTTTRPHFGGLRWWFMCPITGARASKLYLPPGGRSFASRHAYYLAYRSQNENYRDRQLSKALDIRQRLGGSPSVLDAFPEKPKGMHWATYCQLRERSERAAKLGLMSMET